MIARSRQTTAMIAKRLQKNRNDQLTYAINQHEAFAKRRQTAAMVAKCCQESKATMVPEHRRTSAVISSVPSSKRNAASDRKDRKTSPLATCVHHRNVEQSQLSCCHHPTAIIVKHQSSAKFEFTPTRQQRHVISSRLFGRIRTAFRLVCSEWPFQ